MKASFSISSKGSFTVWETGSSDVRGQQGYSVLVANADGSKPQVIFDRDPAHSRKHALFFANIGTLLCGCNLHRVHTTQVEYTLELHSIQKLWTEQVQGKTVPRYGTELLYLGRGLATTDVLAEVRKHIEEIPEIPSVPLMRPLFHAALEKSFLPQKDQRVFWGLPRTPRDTPDSGFYD